MSYHIVSIDAPDCSLSYKDGHPTGWPFHFHPVQGPIVADADGLDRYSAVSG